MNDFDDDCNACEHYNAMTGICLLDGEHVYSDHTCDEFEFVKDLIVYERQLRISADKAKLAAWCNTFGKRE